MKAIIMAAGFGSRIQGVIGDMPKCMIQVEGRTLISRTVSMLKSRGIDDITVITGFKGELIHEELGSKVEYLHNPFYQVTNSIASLWFAKDLLAGDVLLMNADLYFEDGVLDIVLKQWKTVVMLSDSTRIETADFRFGVVGDSILKTGNKLSDLETDCEYVGIVRIDNVFIYKFKMALEKMVQRGEYGKWWESVLYEFIEAGEVIYHEDVQGNFWTEVDNAVDYQRLQRWVALEKVLPETAELASEEMVPAAKLSTWQGI